MCTDSSGLYKRLAILGSSTDRSQYLTDLGNNIVSELKEAASGYKECILHVPFRIGKDELAAISDAVQRALARQQLPKMRFTVLKVNTENKFFGYAHTNSLVPYEGNFVVLEEGGYLIWFDGLQPSRQVVNWRVSGPGRSLRLSWRSSTPCRQRSPVGSSSSSSVTAVLIGGTPVPLATNVDLVDDTEIKVTVGGGNFVAGTNKVQVNTQFNGENRFSNTLDLTLTQSQ